MASRSIFSRSLRAAPAKSLRPSIPVHARLFATKPTPDTSSTPDAETHFGFQTVKESLKAGKVHDVFSSVASSYDVMNDVMSFGIHRLWKDHFVRSLDPGAKPGGQPMKILDVAGGTGDIAFRMLNNAASVHHDWDTSVICADINADMLREGEKRARANGILPSNRISFVEEDAEKLSSIPDASVDLYTISFGIRNVTKIKEALKAAHRVLKPGGVFACLEFSRVKPALLNEVYQRYSFSVIPLMGQLVAGDRDSYQYLVESINRFPSQEEFADWIREAGFVTPGKGYEELTFGVANIWKGVKPVETVPAKAEPAEVIEP